MFHLRRDKGGQGKAHTLNHGLRSIHAEGWFEAVLIIDAEVGPTENDIEMLRSLEATKKSVLIVANKVDKIRKTKTAARLRELQDLFGPHKVIPYSSEKELGRRELAAEIFGPIG